MKKKSFVLRLSEEDFNRLEEISGGNKSRYLRDCINARPLGENTEPNNRIEVLTALREKTEEIMKREDLVPRASEVVGASGAPGAPKGDLSDKATKQFCFENEIEDEGLLGKIQKIWVKDHEKELIDRWEERNRPKGVLRADGLPDKRYAEEPVKSIGGFKGSVFKVSGEKKPLRKWDTKKQNEKWRAI